MMKCIAIFVFSLGFLLAEHEIKLFEHEIDFPFVEKIELVNSENSIFNIYLSDNTVWKTKCDFEAEQVLVNWEKGDGIYFRTKGVPGIYLFNNAKNSGIYAFITKESLESLPFIENIKFITGWFSSPYHVITLSNGEKYKVDDISCNLLDLRLNPRWKVGQKVIISVDLKEFFKGMSLGVPTIVNVSLTLDERFRGLFFDDRSPFIQARICQ